MTMSSSRERSTFAADRPPLGFSAADWVGPVNPGDRAEIRGGQDRGNNCH